MKEIPAPHTRLLLVDDEKGFVDVLTNRLSRRGIQAVKAYSGAQALRALREARFDVMVLDLKMEDMDGIEVLKIVRKMAPDLPVIILTGHGSRTAAEEGMTIGAFDYLTKPCELNELMEKISLARQARNKRNGEKNQ
ncbi:MAG: response regulator [Desulfobacter postgatei]|uniref:response regulator n=1 Tax=Desulfobacter postgatei TaxID=2293 RepID=UPI0023F4391E|nr:response regulator [Desulfobacter postgatei]MDD4272986.1 response regulator [Desulfobacter postgatei]